MDNELKAKADKRREQKMCRRIITCLIILFAFCAAAAGRLFWLQVVRSAELSERVDAQSEADRKIQSPRGMILDRDGKVLAISEVAKSLYADPTMTEKSPAEMARLLAPYLRISEEAIEERLSRDTAFV